MMIACTNSITRRIWLRTERNGNCKHCILHGAEQSFTSSEWFIGYESRVFLLKAKKAFRKEIYSLHKSFISGVLPITTQRGLALLLSASYNRIFDFSKLGLDNGFAPCAANSFPSNSW